jgi:hypothetical protein
MRTLVITAILMLTLSMAPVGALAGENPGGQPVPGVSQQVNDTQLDRCKGKVGDPADYSQVSRTVPTTQRVVDDTVYFSKNVMKTIDGTYGHREPGTGPQGKVGPNYNNIGAPWTRGKDITEHIR